MKSVDHNFYRNLPKEDPLGLVFAIAAIAKSNTVVGVLPRMSVSSYIIIPSIHNFILDAFLGNKISIPIEFYIYILLLIIYQSD